MCLLKVGQDWRGHNLTFSYVSSLVAAIDWSDSIDFVSWGLLILFSTYTGFSLWRYGTSISTDVRATSVNPWASIAVATVALAMAWGFTPASWALPYAVNALEIVLLASL